LRTAYSQGLCPITVGRCTPLCWGSVPHYCGAVRPITVGRCAPLCWGDAPHYNGGPVTVRKLTSFERAKPVPSGEGAHFLRAKEKPPSERRSSAPFGSDLPPRSDQGYRSVRIRPTAPLGWVPLTRTSVPVPLERVGTTH